jgi:GTPase SAR1 family protein
MAVYDPSVLTAVEQRKHEDAYNEILSKGESLNMKCLKFFFLGLPRTGKTSMRKRITGKIDDIKTAPSQDPEAQEPSTGAVEVPRKVILRKATTSSTAVVTSKFEWHFTADLNDEACMLNKLFFEVSGSFHQSRRRGAKSTALKATINLKRQHAADFSQSGLPETTTESATYSMEIPGGMTNLSKHLKKFPKKKSKLPKIPKEKRFTFSSEVEELFTIFRDAMTTGKWDEVHFVLSGTILLYLIDTGGQSEFLEMLPALTLGPALSLIFFKLNEDLKSLYNVVYVDENGCTTLPYESEFTVEEMMFQILSSIACFSSFSGSNAKKSSPDRVRLSDSLQSASILVGTHSDKVSAEEIKEVDDYLQQKIRETNFFKRELVQFFKPERNLMILPIDNMTGGKKEVISIRKFIEDLIDRYFSEIHVPAAWLIFSLCLRKLGKKIFHFEECAVIADKLYMNEEELKEALWFLHHTVGSIMHFSELPELQDMVICDIQVIFDSATRLIVNTYTFGNVHPSVEEKFRKRGIFSLKEIRKAASSSSNLIPLKKLIVLLEHINFIALIQDDHSDMAETNDTIDTSESVESHHYFMPAILKSASRSQLLTKVRVSSVSGDLLPSPVMIHYECGYVPIGMFCALIANLIGRGHKYDPKWSLCEKKEVYKNKVSFIVGVEYDIVTLISHPTYYEITISRPILDFSPPVRPKVATHVLCSQVLSTVKASLKLVCSRMNYPFQMGYNLAFECPDHPEREHLCIVNRDDSSPQVMECLNPKGRKLIRLQLQDSLWFQVSYLEHIMLVQ